MKSQEYPERHWTYESEKQDTYMPAFMNDGYAPPDWELLEEVEEEKE